MSIRAFIRTLPITRSRPTDIFCKYFLILRCLLIFLRHRSFLFFKQSNLLIVSFFSPEKIFFSFLDQEILGSVFFLLASKNVFVLHLTVLFP